MHPTCYRSSSRATAFWSQSLGIKPGAEALGFRAKGSASRATKGSASRSTKGSASRSTKGGTSRANKEGIFGATKGSSSQKGARAFSVNLILGYPRVSVFARKRFSVRRRGRRLWQRFGFQSGESLVLLGRAKAEVQVLRLPQYRLVGLSWKGFEVECKAQNPKEAWRFSRVLCEGCCACKAREPTVEAWRFSECVQVFAEAQCPLRAKPVCAEAKLSPRAEPVCSEAKCPSRAEPVCAEAKLPPRAEPVCAEAKPRAEPRSRAQQAVCCSRVVGAGVAWVKGCCSVSWSVERHVACVSWSVDQHVACVPWVVVLEREVKEHGNDDNPEPCVELVRGCTTGGCDENVSEPPKVNQHRLCALRGLPVVIPVPDEDEELIPASMPEPVGSEEPTSGPGPELEQPKPDEDPEPELHVPLGDKEYQEHVARGHQPYLPSCTLCVSSRGVIPARRRRDPAIPQASFLSDFLFFTKDLRVCLVVHELSGYCFGVPFATGEDPVRVAKAINAELSFAGVQGQHMVLRMDNESTLQALWNRAGKDRTFPALSLHIDSVAKGRPQQKGQVEVGVRHFKEAFWVNWLTLETALEKKLRLGGLLYKEALRYVGRTRNLHATSKSQTTPIERMRRQHLPVATTFPFGCKGFAKPSKSKPEDRGRRLIPCMYLGPGKPNGGGVRVLPLDRPDEVEVMAAFRPELPYVYPEDVVIGTSDAGAQVRQDVLERPVAYELKPPEPYQPGDEPAGSLVEKGPLEGQGASDEELMEYSPDAEDFAVEPPPEGPPVGVNEAPPLFDVDMQPDDEDDPTEVAISWLQDHALYSMCSRPEVVFAAKSTEGSRGSGLEFTLKFGGSKVKVEVPSGAADEYTGEVLEEKKLGEGMRLEMEELDNFGVWQVVSEKEAFRLVREAKRRILSTRWVLHYKDGHRRVRCRLVVRDFKGPTSALADGIYSPTTTLESVRCLLGMYAHFGGQVISGDISVAFMQARQLGSFLLRW